jgi:general secretion pathway protein B
MSFILDALKKSEAERQRQNAPGIASIPEGGRQERSSKWILIIAGLLTVNLIVISGLVMKSDSETAAPPVQTPNSVSVAKPPPEKSPGIVNEAQRNTPPTYSTEQVESVQPVASAPVELPVTAERPATMSEGLPSFDDLRVQGILQLPDMHLDIHVYSGQPADRFVFVNMSKYKESATLAEGPVVSEIVPEGVVLEYQGKRFLLPRE